MKIGVRDLSLTGYDIPGCVVVNDKSEMTDIYAAHLRHHYRISPREWRLSKYSEQEILEWYFEYFFIKNIVRVQKAIGKNDYSG